MTKSIEAYIEEAKTSPDGPSASGFHFIQEYLANPYSFYLRYVRGLRPTYTAPPLIQGRAVHAAVEIAYKAGLDGVEVKADELVSIYQTLLSADKAKYAKSTDFDADLDKGSAMLKAWHNTWYEHDFSTYTILHVEETFNVELANSFVMTIKPDAVVKDKDGYIYIKDIKTTGRGTAYAHEYLSNSDQSSAYLWGVEKAYPKNYVGGIISDVMFMRSNMKSAKAERPAIVTRSKWDLKTFELEMIGLLEEMSQKVQAYHAGVPASYLFPRNSKDESAFGRNNWPNVWRSPLPADPNEAPYGYYVDKELIKQTFTGLEETKRMEFKE